MTARLLITVDTNVIDVAAMSELRAAVTIPHEFGYVDVTEDERGLKEVKLTGDYGAPVAGVFVLDDAGSGVLDGSRVLAGDGIGDLLPDALGTGFVNFGKREANEELGQTRILLVAEFLALARIGGRAVLRSK